MHISFALKSLGITQYTLKGNTTTEVEFRNNFKKVASVDAEGNPTFTDDWGFTWAELKAKYDELVAAEPLTICKDEAKKRIAACDWSVSPDVGLANVAAFQTYRATLRELIKNPVAEPTWPTEPEPIWS